MKKKKINSNLDFWFFIDFCFLEKEIEINLFLTFGLIQKGLSLVGYYPIKWMQSFFYIFIAFSFSLNEKETKNQERKMLRPALDFF